MARIVLDTNDILNILKLFKNVPPDDIPDTVILNDDPQEPVIEFIYE